MPILMILMPIAEPARAVRWQLLQRGCLLFTALWLSACSSLPEIGFLRDRKPVPEREPATVNTQGRPRAQGAETLLDRAKAAGSTAILQRHVAAEEMIAGRPLMAGNKVTLLEDGPMTMRAMMAAIRTATDHINLENCIVENDEAGQRLADLLIAKRAEDVKVNVIYDSASSTDVPRAFFTRMREAGIRMLEFNPLNPLHARKDWDANQRDHRKLLVIDGKTAFIGGVNTGMLDRNSPKQPAPRGDALAWRNPHMQIEGPGVAEFQRLFLETWQRKTGIRLDDANYFPALRHEGKALVRAIGSTPQQQDTTVHKSYVSALTHADKTIYLTMPYFAPDRQILRAMIHAARRGVDVRIIFPGVTDHGAMPEMLEAGRSWYGELLDAGIRIHEHESATLHAGSAVIDGVWSTIGSTSLDMRNVVRNDEINAVVLDAEFGARMQALFERELRASVEITAEQWSKQRGFLQRIKDWMARLFGG